MKHPPVEPTAPPWGKDRLLGYEWLVQPILDEHCVSCHGTSEPDGGIDLSRTRADDGLFQSFRTLFGIRPDGTSTDRTFVSVANRFSDSSVTKPMQFGSHRSSLMETLLTDPLHQREVKLSDEQWYALVTWIDSNAPYHDRFIDKRPKKGVDQWSNDHKLPFRLSQP
jgi:hypothetical protein